MSLLQPLGLLGLLSLPVIVLLHLWHERNRNAVIPSLNLWNWLEREVRGPQMRLPPLTPVLLLQLAAAALLSLALARPRLDFLAGPAALNRVVVVVDTSSSMAAVDLNPSRLGWAQARATQLLAGLSAHDSAALIIAGPQPRLIADSRQVGVTGLLSALVALEPAGVGQDWPGTLALAAAAALPEHNNRIVIYSDGAFAFPEHLAAAAYPARVEWQSVGGPQPNQAVVALAARPTGTGGLQVFARLANFSDRAAERTMTLTTDGQVFDSHAVQLTASGTLGQVWTLPPGISTVQLSLSGGDVLPADDTAALGLQDSRPVEAVLVAEDGAAVARALRSIPTLNLTTLTPDEYVPFAGHELTVFQGWLPAVLPQGGVLIFDPPPGSDVLPVIGYDALGAVPPPTGDPLFDDVALEHVFFGTAAQLAQQPWLAPVLSDDSDPHQHLIWRGSQAGSRVVVFSLVLDDTNLARRAAFPILVANAVSEVLPPALPASLRAGEALALPPAEIFAELTVTGPDGAAHTFGADEARAFGGTTQAGLYALTSTFASGQPWRAAVGVNAGALDESDLRVQAAPDFQTSRQGGAFGGNPSDGLELWPLLVGLVALALLVEARLAWR
jgi:hypothetical protein